jgi:diguanylate cyclase (GGDEF)-like protein
MSPVMGSLGVTAAARARDLRLALLGTVVPVLAALASDSFSHRLPFLIGAAGTCAAPLIVTLVDRRHRLAFWLGEFGGIVALTAMQSYSGGAASGYSVLVVMAMIWFGLRATARELVAGALLLALCSYLPMLVFGPPAYPVRAGNATMLVLVGVAVAITLRTVKGETLRLTRRLRQEAVIDDLTGLLNRRGWRDMAFVEFQRARHRGGAVALVTIDLDAFKALNDEHGHEHGDRALREAAHWMQASFRARDIVARLGGDEFVVLLADVTLDGAMAALSRMRDAPLRTAFSAGVAMWDGCEDLAALMHRSDRALYAAKSQGGRRTLVAAPLHGALRLVGAQAS